MPGRVDDRDGGAADGQRLAVGEVDVPQLGPLLVAAVGELPQGPVVGVEQNRSTGTATQLGRDAYVVVVGVRAHDGLDRPAGDDLEDGVDVVRGVDDDALLIVADHPHVVVDLVGLPVQGEGPGDDGVVHPRGHQSTTTERSTLCPSGAGCILSKAASTSPMPISSVTKASRSSRPCW